ncbi:endolytic transglycosylase MltG [Cohnella sp. JJ-181]|uniref:endolytic transglycosylase MltG n=1 Tax=Cohnella rhizoplanae TaxID=2974897 RepID=UPI0022FFA43F|nr:endolytic transglycosylase MltG [Cohnella sp. JJ-181]CAI6015264.1 Endolytic murein transglycosylase [Cohnella sp. JJ-181]
MSKDDDNNGWKSVYSGNLPDDREDTEAAPNRERGEAEQQEIAPLPPRARTGSTAERTGAPPQGNASVSAAAAGKPEPNPASEPEEAEDEDDEPPKKGHAVLWSFLIALGLVVVVAASALFYVWNGLRPPAAADQQVRVTISKGMGAKKVGESLEAHGLIRNTFLFSMWLKYKNEGSRFQAGEYDFTPGMTNGEIVAKLNNGSTVAAATVRFTIPEGFTVVQIADRLAKEGIVDKDKFMNAVRNPVQIANSTWTKQIPEDKDLRYPIEGYLFPETYEMKKGSTESDIIDRMLAELDRKLGTLPEDWQSVLEERGWTLHELLTAASLVEREVVVDEERPIVAGVILNRLDQKMPLQIDATIQYLLDKQKEKLTNDDLKVDSPYNTYLTKGLPPGPISSPSLKSIEAVLYPADTDYLYYVTKKDGTNTHLFAETYKQHQKNIRDSEKNEK